MGKEVIMPSIGMGQSAVRPQSGKSSGQKNPPPAVVVRGGGRIVDSGLLSHMKICSIIGDGELNCQVRNGIGCTLSSMAANEICN